MTPEEKNLERFVREKQKADKKGALFNLEDDELTHFGQPLAYDPISPIEDFNEDDIELSNASQEEQELNDRPSKRRRVSDETVSNNSRLATDVDAQPERPKTKNEVMKEVVAKSKLYKYERQQAKEDDDDLRAELDKGLPDLFALMRGTPKKLATSQQSDLPNGVMNPDRLALLNGKDRAQADKEYDERLKEYTFDQRSRPTVRTLTEEEKLEQGATKLKKLEDQRLRRMRGEPDSEEDDDSHGIEEVTAEGDPDPEDEDRFGLGSGISGERKRKELDVEEEDDFVIEDDLIASGSDMDFSDAEDSALQSDHEASDDEDREFVQGLLSKDDAGREELKRRPKQGTTATGQPFSNLPFTFPW